MGLPFQMPMRLMVTRPRVPGLVGRQNLRPAGTTAAAAAQQPAYMLACPCVAETATPSWEDVATDANQALNAAGARVLHNTSNALPSTPDTLAVDVLND